MVTALATAASVGALYICISSSSWKLYGSLLEGFACFALDCTSATDE